MAKNASTQARMSFFKIYTRGEGYLSLRRWGRDTALAVFDEGLGDVGIVRVAPLQLRLVIEALEARERELFNADGSPRG